MAGRNIKSLLICRFSLDLAVELGAAGAGGLLRRWLLTFCHRSHRRRIHHLRRLLRHRRYPRRPPSIHPRDQEEDMGSDWRCWRCCCSACWLLCRRVGGGGRNDKRQLSVPSRRWLVFPEVLLIWSWWMECMYTRVALNAYLHRMQDFGWAGGKKIKA